MNFLYPGFLFALAAVAIPILIHLFNLRKFRKVYFSNVSFLKEVEQQSSSRQKLKNLLILFSRILAVIFLVLAFSKPYLAGKDTSAPSKSRQVSVYIDNSFSMAAVNREGSLLDEAKTRARQIVSSYSLNDKFQLLTNEFEGRQKAWLSRAEFLDALNDVRISPVRRNLQQITQRQLADNDVQASPERFLYLISDFQTNMLPSKPIKLSKQVEIRLVRLKPNSTSNISIDSLWFTSPVHKPGATEHLVVRLKNNSDADVANVPVRVFVGNRQKAIGSISVNARSPATDTLTFSGMAEGWQQGEVQIKDHPIVFDDHFYFAFNVRKSISILAINFHGVNPYLQALYKADPFFALNNSEAGNVDYAALKTHQLIILNDAANFTPGLSQQLQNYVKDGGSLMVYPALTADLASLTSFLQSLQTDVPEAVVSAETKVKGVNLAHPVFKGVFEKVPSLIDLPTARSYLKYAHRSRTLQSAILDFPGNVPFIREYKSGRGKVYLSAVPLDEQASNLVRHAIFVPLMYQAAFQSVRAGRLSYVLGQDEYLEINRTALGPNQVLRLKKGTFETIPDLRQTQNDSRLFIADQLRDEGNYQLFREDSLLGVFAFNNDRSESNLAYASDAQLRKFLGASLARILSPDRESLPAAIKAADYGTQLWKVCIILALIFLAAEIVLIRLFKTTEIKTLTVNEKTTH